MNIEDKIGYSERTIAAHQAMVAFLKQNREFLEKFEGTVFESCGVVHFTSQGETLTREQTLSIIRYFHGKWNKAYDQDRVSYEREKSEHEALGIGIYQAEAPASCRIEEVEEFVPGHIIKKRRLVCTEKVEPPITPEPSSVEAFAHAEEA